MKNLSISWIQKPLKVLQIMNKPVEDYNEILFD
jgi:hypothetical protein